MSEEQEDVIYEPEDIEAEDITLEEPKKKIEPEHKGHMSKEAWIAAGKDPEEWRDPVEFKWRGELIKQKKEHEAQIKNLNFLHEQRLSMERASLLSQRDNAIDIADKAEVKRLDAAIANVDKQQDLLTQNQVVETQAKHPLEAQWEAENQWVFDQTDPRSSIAIAAYQDALQKGKTVAEALVIVDDYVDRKFGKVTKQTNQIVEPSRTAGGKRESSSGMSWSDLTPMDVKIFNEVWPKSGDAAKDKRAYLKAIADEKKV